MRLPPAMRLFCIASLAALSALSLPLDAHAIPGDELWSEAFARPGTNGTVYASTLFNGNLVIGGDFTCVGREPANRVAMWNGTAWSAMDTGFDSEVRSLYVWNSELYAGGLFTFSGATPIRRLAKWTGTNWVEVGGGADDGVLALIAYGTNLIVAGDMTSVGTGGGQVSVESIAAWSGSAWQSLNSGFGAFTSVYDVEVFQGLLYAGGNFSDAGGQSAGNIASYDGAQWDVLGGGVQDGGGDPDNAQIVDLAVHSSRLIVAGSFELTASDANSRDGIVAWSGSNWVDMGIVDGLGEVGALGNIGGDLYVSAFNVWRHGGGGLYFYQFSGPTGVGAITEALGEYAGDLLVLGKFSTFDGASVENILHWDGTAIRPFGEGEGAEAVIHELAVWNGKLVAGGQFDAIGGLTRPNEIAAWDGTSWASLGGGVNAPGSASILALRTFGTDLIAGGTFTTIGGVAANRVARWDGTGWNAMGSGSVGTVNALGEWNGDLYGYIHQTVGTGTVSRWTGSAWSPIATPVFGGNIQVMAVYNNDLIVGGFFNTMNGLAINKLARFDGTTWTALGGGIPGALSSVNDLFVHNGLLYVAGSFSTAGTVSAANLAVWNGANWTEWAGGANAACNDIELFNGDLVVTGGFTTIGASATPADRIARWDGTQWHPMGSGLDGSGNAMATYGNKLYVGGLFTGAGTHKASRVTRWDGVSTTSVPGGGATAIGHQLRIGPNPSKNGSTSIWFRLGAGVSRGELAIFDLSGRRVRMLEEGVFGTATRRAEWDGRTDSGAPVAGGVYLARLVVDDGTSIVQRVTVLP